jgi:hypothetical protein
MPATEMVITIAAFAAMLVAFIHVVRLIGLAVTHYTLRRAIERDPASAESILSRLATGQEPTTGDDRLGVLLVALGAAMIGASLIAGETGDWMRYGIGGALFPLIIGAALWARHFMIERARRRGEPK